MTWACPVCGCAAYRALYPAPGTGTEGGVDPDAFRPSTERFGRALGDIVECRTCGHGSLLEQPAVDAVAAAYASAEDPVSLREEEGQVRTADRALAEIERLIRPGRVCDIGCWTGSFLVAARTRGWDPVGVEPSAWASARARARGLDVRTAGLDDHGQASGSCRLVVIADVLEHLPDPGRALGVAHDLLEPGGALYVTVPDAGSALARMLGRRWWSVLPMHLQYFTRASLTRLVESSGFEVRALRSHAKAFTARYYAERLGGYSPALERAAVKSLEVLNVADRLVAPDLRDRMALLAIRS